MPWWSWIVLGVFLLGAEMAISSEFYLVFLGLSALCVGGLTLVGVSGPVWAQWLLFGLFAIVSLTVLRKRVAKLLGRETLPSIPTELVGEIAISKEHIAPAATGQVELRGAVWSARNVGSAPLEAGQRARVERTEGLLLHLKKEEL